MARSSWPQKGVPETRGFPPCDGFFLASAQTVSQSAVPGASTLRVRRRSKAVDFDCGEFLRRGLKDCPVVVGLNELAPIGGWPAGGRHGRRLEWFAEVCENLTSRGRSHPGLRPRANLRFEVSRFLPAVSTQPDVAAAVRALERKLLPHPRHELGPGNP